MAEIDRDKVSEPPRVPCAVCMREVPRSEASSAEGAEYVLHFFGLECYDLWRRDAEQPPPET